MLSIKWIQDVDYYLDRARPDYYFQGGEPEGIWWGRGAADLGLMGTVQPEQLAQLFKGFSPAGKELIQNAGAKNHQAAWDLTFTVPKSVSVFWSQADATTRRRLQQLHLEAVQEALAYLQQVAVLTRRDKGGVRQEPAHLVVAMFEHASSREFQPLLHTHCVVPNVATRNDRSSGTILSKPLYRHKLTAGALYRAGLDAKLRSEFGLRTRRDGTSFKLDGVPDGLCHEQSTRRQQITKILNSRGHHSAKAAAVATLATRKSKEIPPPRQTLFATWQQTNRKHGFTTSVAQNLLGRSPTLQIVSEINSATADAANYLLEKQAHFSEQELVRATAIHAQGRGIPARDILRAVRALLADEESIVKLAVRKGELRYTTQAMLMLEKTMLSSIEERQHDDRFLLQPDRIKALLDLRLPLESQLSDDDLARNLEQRLAVEHLVLKAGQFQVAEGKAGTGKTFMLGVCREAWEAAGFRVLGIALSGVAARNLQEGSGITSDTLTMRLSQFDRKGGFRRHHRRQLSRLAKGKSTHVYRPRQLLDSRTIVVLDEASMVSTEQFAKLVDKVQRRGAKLVIVGDRKQLQAIQAGGSQAAIASRIGAADLQHIVRQKPASHDPHPYWAREAVHHFSEGRAHEALKLYAERGLVTVAENRDDAMWHLVQDWSRHGIQRPAENIILAGTNAEVDRLNEMCQATRLVMHERAPKSIRIGSEQIAVGDQVLFSRKSRLLGLENGDRGSVVGIDWLRQVLAIQLNSDQRRVFVPLKEYQEVRLGYATTGHKSQGATYDNAFVLVGGMMQDLHLSYVQASRTTDTTRFYVDRFEAGHDLGDLATQMSQQHEKELAHDIADQPGDAPAIVAADGSTVPPAGTAPPSLEATSEVASRTALEKPFLNTGDTNPSSVRARSQAFRDKVFKEREQATSTSENAKKSPLELLAQLRKSRRPKKPAEPSPTAASLSTNNKLAEKLQLAEEFFRGLREPSKKPAAANPAPKKSDKSTPRSKPKSPAVFTRIGKPRKSSTRIQKPAADALMFGSKTPPSVVGKPSTQKQPGDAIRPDAVASHRGGVKTTQPKPPIRGSNAEKTGDIDLSHIAIAVTLDLAYLRAALRRYGRMPGGIVVEENATSSVQLRSLRIDPSCPTHVLVNDRYTFDTRLSADEVACIWHAVSQSPSDYNFGAINQVRVAGIERDTSVAATLMRADNTLGGLVYGYDFQHTLTPTLTDGYVNPFTTTAALVSNWTLPEVRRIATNHRERVRPQLFLCFSKASFQVVAERSLTVSTSLLTAAMATLSDAGDVVNEVDAAKRRFPLEHAAMVHVIENFRRYGSMLPEFARCSAYAELVQLLRLGKSQQATLHEAARMAESYGQRQRHPVPRHSYTSRSPQYAELCRTTAEAIAERLIAGTLPTIDMGGASIIGLDYARQSGDVRLATQFKRRIIDKHATDRRYYETWPHDALVMNCLVAAKNASVAAEAESYFRDTLKHCQPAMEGLFADPATICCYVEAMCRQNPKFEPLPDLRRALTQGNFRNLEVSLLPFSTLSTIIYDLQTSELARNNERHLPAALKRLETELGVASLKGIGLSNYRLLRDRPDKRAHFVFLETMRRRETTFADFGAVMENYRPTNELAALAGIAIYRLRKLKPRKLGANFLHRANPFFLSRPLIALLTTSEVELVRSQLEVATMRDVKPATMSWWNQVMQAYGIGLNGSLIFAGELFARKKTMAHLREEMQRYKVANPQEGLFWLDLRDAEQAR